MPPPSLLISHAMGGKKDPGLEDIFPSLILIVPWSPSWRFQSGVPGPVCVGNIPDPTTSLFLFIHSTAKLTSQASMECGAGSRLPLGGPMATPAPSPGAARRLCKVQYSVRGKETPLQFCVLICITSAPSLFLNQHVQSDGCRPRDASDLSPSW